MAVRAKSDSDAPRSALDAEALPLLSLSGLSKTFPGQRALDGVSVDIAPGQVHALLGTNGSGKSTLIKILAGVVQPDLGATVHVGGNAYPLVHGARGGELHGLPIRCVHQDLGLVAEMSVLDNIGLGDGFRRTVLGTIAVREQERRARELLDRVGATDVDVGAPLGRYDRLIHTQVAVARELGGWGEGPVMLVLDEPTATLPAAQAERLFEIVRQVREAGNAVLYVTHRLAEVFELSDSVTVLRQGRVVHAGPTSGLDRARLVEAMVGHRVSESEGRAAGSGKPSNVRLALKSVEVAGSGSIDLEVGEGEIVGLAGVPGAGHELVTAALAGAVPAKGEIVVDGVARSLHGLSPRGAIELGLAFIPPDRKRQALIEEMTVADNVALPLLDQFRRLGLLSDRQMSDSVRFRTDRVHLSPPDPSREVRLLSGGNQQKVVVARSFALSPRLLLLAEPTAGVDVGAREQIWSLLLEATASGMSALLTSSDLGDHAALCDRVLIFKDGSVHDELHAPNTTEPAISAAMLESHV